MLSSDVILKEREAMACTSTYTYTYTLTRTHLATAVVGKLRPLRWLDHEDQDVQPIRAGQPHGCQDL